MSSASRDSGHIPATRRYRETSALASTCRDLQKFPISLAGPYCREVWSTSTFRVSPDWHPRCTPARSISRATFSEKSDRENEHFSRYRSMLADKLVYIYHRFFKSMIKLHEFYRAVLNNVNKRNIQICELQFLNDYQKKIVHFYVR